MSDLDLARRIELERADAERSALERAIESIESLENTYRNDIYRKAWKVAVRSLRSLMPGATLNPTLIDKSHEQI